MPKYNLQNDSFSIIESKNKNEVVSSDDGELPDSDGEIGSLKLFKLLS